MVKFDSYGKKSDGKRQPEHQSKFTPNKRALMMQACKAMCSFLESEDQHQEYEEEDNIDPF